MPSIEFNPLTYKTPQDLIMRGPVLSACQHPKRWRIRLTVAGTDTLGDYTETVVFTPSEPMLLSGVAVVVSAELQNEDRYPNVTSAYVKAEIMK